MTHILKKLRLQQKRILVVNYKTSGCVVCIDKRNHIRILFKFTCWTNNNNTVKCMRNYTVVCFTIIVLYLEGLRRIFYVCVIPGPWIFVCKHSKSILLVQHHIIFISLQQYVYCQSTISREISALNSSSTWVHFNAKKWKETIVCWELYVLMCFCPP